MVTTAQQSYQESVELAVEAEKLGVDGAWFRVHHFADQIGTPYPLMAAIAAKTSRIEIGTGVVDMRYENPYMMAENVMSTDVLSQNRVQLASVAGLRSRSKTAGSIGAMIIVKRKLKTSPVSAH